jgi:hypothetical protein
MGMDHFLCWLDLSSKNVSNSFIFQYLKLTVGSNSALFPEDELLPGERCVLGCGASERSKDPCRPTGLIPCCVATLFTFMKFMPCYRHWPYSSLKTQRCARNVNIKKNCQKKHRKSSDCRSLRNLQLPMTTGKVIKSALWIIEAKKRVGRVV